MPIYYESKADQKRVENLRTQRNKAFFFMEMSSIGIGTGLGTLLSGSKSIAIKAIGWTSLVAGALGGIYSYLKGKGISTELEKPENASVVLEGKLPGTGTVAKVTTMLDSRLPIQGVPSDEEVIQGRQAWEERMAEENAKRSGQVSK